MGPVKALATTARHQLIQFYKEIGLPTTLADMGMDRISIAQLKQAAAVACHVGTDIHHLPFPVDPEQVMAAMVSTIAPTRLQALLPAQQHQPTPIPADNSRP